MISDNSHNGSSCMPTRLNLTEVARAASITCVGMLIPHVLDVKHLRVFRKPADNQVEESVMCHTDQHTSSSAPRQLYLATRSLVLRVKASEQ